MNETDSNNGNAQIGFRLQYMEIFNWGTFHNKIWKIEPNGNNSLLTGSIGSGKSTIVDALTCLIVPHNKITFNKAAGAEGKERNLISYIKGNYSSKSDDLVSGGKAVSLRYKDPDDSTFTVIVANFTNVGYHSNISLAQILWIENEKAQKILLISTKPLNIKEYFTNIKDPRELRKSLKEHSFIESFDDNFSQYSQRFRHLFGMNSEKAIDLFYQTVSMKSVSSLTTFVREQMLERTEIKTQIEDLKKRFDDLNKAYAAVQEARRQRDTLTPMVELDEKYRSIESRIKDIDLIIQTIPSYFSTKKIDLLINEISDCERKLLQLEGQLKTIDDTLRAKRKAENQINLDIDSNGGARLKEISKEIEEREKLRDSKQNKHNDYTMLTSFCELANANSDKAFFSNLKEAEKKIADLSARQEEILGELGSLTGKKAQVIESIEQEQKELDSLKNRPNQIPLDILNIREELATNLQIDKEEIPFAGELMQVNENERAWEGAIERLLRGFGISMLVPEKYYQQISQYVNARTLYDHKGKRAKLDYIPVYRNFKTNQPQSEIDDDSVVNKIDIKSGSQFEDWIMNELENSHNIRCVSLSEFQQQKRDVMTKEGQIKRGKKHTKDDRRDIQDRRGFVLGWTNEEKIKAIEKLLDELKKERKQIEEQLAELNSENKNNSVYQVKLNQIISYKDWTEINWQDEAKTIAKLGKEKEELGNSNNILKTLQEKLEIITNEILDLEGKKSELQGSKGIQVEKIANNEEAVKECMTVSETLTSEEKQEFFPKIDTEITDKELTVKNIDKEKDVLLKAKHEERKQISNSQSGVRDKIIKLMKDYKTHFPSDSLELTEEIESRNEYLNKLEKITKEGLPEFERRFKDMLNKNTIDDIVAFDNKLDIHEKSIRDKINTINRHLKEIIYDKNKETYIKLLADRNTDPDISNFKKQLKDCYSGILDTSDAYTEDRFNEVQKILNRFRSNTNVDVDWTNKVTDVRNWFVFNARENFLSNDEEYQFYAGSSGKSGGQKEKLAYTILASALAYQFGLSYGEPKSKTFRFVVIDEAFGRGDDESTQFGLGLFKKLNLQLLIVTPLQKIHVIENYINSVHYVSNTEGSDSQLQNLTVEEYKTEKHLHNSVTTSVKVIETEK